MSKSNSLEIKIEKNEQVKNNMNETNMEDEIKTEIKEEVKHDMNETNMETKFKTEVKEEIKIDMNETNMEAGTASGIDFRHTDSKTDEFNWGSFQADWEAQQLENYKLDLEMQNESRNNWESALTSAPEPFSVEFDPRSLSVPKSEECFLALNNLRSLLETNAFVPEEETTFPSLESVFDRNMEREIVLSDSLIEVLSEENELDNKRLIIEGITVMTTEQIPREYKEFYFHRVKQQLMSLRSPISFKQFIKELNSWGRILDDYQKFKAFTE